MGWLRESMAQAGLKSFGELARQALAHSDWPEDSRARPRSLEAILGRLDRREELEWLADRPGIQQILAELLKLSVSEIRSILVDHAGNRPTVTRLRLDDLRSARTLDLTQEPLLPSIPDRVSLPATWTRCCWLADAGSGFSLAAQWLSARGLAQCTALESAEDIGQLPLSGAPLYVEASADTLSALAAWPSTRPLCVAVAADPSAEALAQFEVLTSTPVESCLEQIVDWVLFRLAGRSQALREPLLEWLRGHPSAWGLLRTLGDALGLIGAYLDGPPGLAQAPTKEDLLEQWLRHRTAESTRERHRDLAGISKSLPDTLVELAQSVVLDDTRALTNARAIEEWLALVPEQFRRGPDIDWLTTRLVADNLPLRKLDLERAARRLPPGAHRLVVALRDLSILRPVSARRFAIRPHFVARLADSIARDRVIASPALFWGEALLRTSTRSALLPTLQQRARVRPESLAEDILEHVDPDNPALVCAFESAFVLIGLAVLEGAELNEQLCASLLEEQDAMLLTNVGTLPLARMLPAQPANANDLPGTFYLAAWALSEHARMHGAGSGCVLDPWHAKQLVTSWPLLLDCVHRALQAAAAEEAPWLAGAIRLLDRLRQAVGSRADETEEPHDVFLPGALLDAVELGVLEFGQFCLAMKRQATRALFRKSALVRNVSLTTIAQGVFAAWADTEKSIDEIESVLEAFPELLSHAPPAVLAELLLSERFEAAEEFMLALPLSAWQQWIEARARAKLETEAVRPWNYVPEALLERALVLRPASLAAIRAIVWRRSPETAARQIERLRTPKPAEAAAWLNAATAERAPYLAEFAMHSDWLHAADAVTTELTRALYRGVSARVSGWQVAYEFLTKLEIERRRFS